MRKGGREGGSIYCSLNSLMTPPPSCTCSPPNPLRQTHTSGESAQKERKKECWKAEKENGERERESEERESGEKKCVRGEREREEHRDREKEHREKERDREMAEKERESGEREGGAVREGGRVAVNGAPAWPLAQLLAALLLRQRVR